MVAVKQDANETISAYLYRLRQAAMQYGGLTELGESQKEDTKTMTVVSSAAERDTGQETAVKGKQQGKMGQMSQTDYVVRARGRPNLVMTLTGKPTNTSDT